MALPRTTTTPDPAATRPTQEHPVSLNPDCTPGWTTTHTGGRVTAHCGCGWNQPGHESRTAAKAAQRDHRFPPIDRSDDPELQRMTDPAATKNAGGPSIDRHGDIWQLGTDGRLWSYETAPFTRGYVERKWGPLRPAAQLTDAVTATNPFSHRRTS